MKFKKEYYTIGGVCNMLNIETPKHITTNKKLSRTNDAQYDIIRQTNHDGTIAFTYELLGRAVEGLINKTSYYKPDDTSNVVDIKYEIGLISVATVFGEVYLPAGRFPGEKQRVRIPVKCHLIKTPPTSGQ